MERKRSYNNISVITDGSYRAVQAHELAKELVKLGVEDSIQISCGLEVIDEAIAAEADYKVNILDPQSNYDAFDMVVISSHEPHPQHDNIVEVTGLINHISPEYLEGRQRDFGLGDNMLAVLVGGRHVGGNFSVNDANLMAAQLNDINLPLLVTTSRRTEEASAKALREALVVPHVFYDFNHDGQAANPYEAMLASASRVMVTSDSARMVSEAASSGRELFIFWPSQRHFSYDELCNKVLAAKHPLRESRRVAEIIKSRLQK